MRLHIRTSSGKPSYLLLPTRPEMRRAITGIDVAFVVAVLLPKATRAAAEQVNVTVDDSAPDPYTGMNITYTPAKYWNEGQHCSRCSAKPDASYTHGSTWHDTTYDPRIPLLGKPITNATFNFIGMWIYSRVRSPSRHMTVRFGDIRVRDT